MIQIFEYLKSNETATGLIQEAVDRQEVGKILRGADFSAVYFIVSDRREKNISNASELSEYLGGN